MQAQSLAAAAAALLLGAAIGIAGFTFSFAEGASYLTNDPEACGNCHVMQQQLQGWRHSSHRSVAVCNDCHTPPGFVNKYFTKALNGWNHSVAFTLGGFHEPIQIGQRNREVTESACRKCHGTLAAALDASGPVECIRCHATVGHD